MTEHVAGDRPPVEELAGRYRLGGLLGRGGMGEVWSATDPVLRRSVAVKLLPTLSGADLERRFQREAATLAGLRHPGITVVHDAGRHGGFLFIVMELLDGTDLGQLMAGHRDGLPLDRALDLAAQTAEAVGAAHGNGVVHRDLKPANVFVQAQDRVKVCDFGIARSADATSALTATGLIVGTPPYMSPEQCRSGEVDARSDLYSFGCALFEMLTGAPPFPPDQSVYAMLHQHISEPPPRLADVRPDLPAALDALVGALLAKEPEARPESAAHVAEELATLRASRVPRPTVPDVVPPVPTLMAPPAAAAGPVPAPEAPPAPEPAPAAGLAAGPERALAPTSAPAPVAGLAEGPEGALAPDVSPGLRIARLIHDQETRAHALRVLAVASAAEAPDTAEALTAEIHVRYRDGALLQLADALDGAEPTRVRRLLEQADKLVGAFPSDEPGEDARALVFLGRLWMALDPAHGLGHLERASEQLPLIEDDTAYWCAQELAEAASALAPADPFEAARLMNELQAAVARLDVEVEYPQFLPSRLAEIAFEGLAADPVAAERLLRLAERTAEEFEVPELTREFLAPVVALFDLDRARRIVEELDEEHNRHSAWGKIIKAVGEHQPDRVEEVLAASGFHRPPASTDLASTDPAPPVPKLPARGMRRYFGRPGQEPAGHTRPTPPATPAGQDGPYSLMYVAEAAAPYAAGWAERVASRITDPYWRAGAFRRMALAVAKDSPRRAERWLNRAFDLALEALRTEDAHHSAQVMGDIAEAAIPVVPDIARKAAGCLARIDADALADESTYRLACLAENVGVIDPYGAIRLVGLVEGRDDASDEFIRRQVAGAQIGAAATLARSNMELAEATIRRAGRALAAMTDLERVAWADWDPLAELAAKRRDDAFRLGGWALEEVEGETRDQVLKSLAAAFAPVDLPHAEQLALAVVDRSLRDEALSGIVQALFGEQE